MRKLIPAVVLMLAAGSAVAQEPQSPPANESGQAARGKKEMTAIVVSTDASVKMITVRMEGDMSAAAEQALPVTGSAVARLSTIKAGDKVKLVLTTDPATSKSSVTSIEKSKVVSDTQ
jgi:hypothetical protein